MTTRKTPDTWRELQQAVADVFAADGYAVEVEKSIRTTRSTVNFDVYAERSVGGHRTTVVVECKHWKENVPQMVVHAFRAQVDDLGAGGGYIVSSSGFQSGAFEASRNTSVRLVTWTDFLAQFEPDGLPLAPGLRGSAELLTGTISFFDRSGALMPFTESKITGGTLRQNPAGGLLLWIETRAPLPALQQSNDEIGWKGFELTTASETLSTDGASPTAFTGKIEFTKPFATSGLNPMTGLCALGSKRVSSLRQRNREGIVGCRSAYKPCSASHSNARSVLGSGSIAARARFKRRRTLPSSGSNVLGKDADTEPRVAQPTSASLDTLKEKALGYYIAHPRPGDV